MLLPYKDLLANKIIILGSQSPRRKEIMERLGLKIEVYPSKFAEDLVKENYQDQIKYVQDTCQGKVKEVIERMEKENKQWDLAVFGDTVCIQDGQIIEKPENEQHVIEMIQKFSGKQHYVIGAINVLIKDSKGNIIQESFVEKTVVNFAQIPQDVIESYSKTEHPWGKSGAYGYQDVAGSFVTGIEGCFYNVVGLPMTSLAICIKKLMQKAEWI